MMNKTIAIIGASTGIGKALVLEAAKNEQFKVIAFARKTDLMEKSFQGLKNVSCHYLDLENINTEKFSSCLKIAGPIDFLVNNAGYLVNKSFHEMDKNDLIKSLMTLLN